MSNPEKQRLQSKTVRSFGKQKSAILVTTFHSSKGLEFDTTIVIDLDSIWKSPSAPGLRNRIAYVAVSRAKSRLCVLTLQQGEFAKRLQNASIEQLKHWTCDSKGKIARRNEQK